MKGPFSVFKYWDKILLAISPAWSMNNETAAAVATTACLLLLHGQTKLLFNSAPQASFHLRPLNKYCNKFFNSIEVYNSITT